MAFLPGEYLLPPSALPSTLMQLLLCMRVPFHHVQKLAKGKPGGENRGIVISGSFLKA